MRYMRIWFGAALIWPAFPQGESVAVSGENCTFRADPGEYATRELRQRREVYDLTLKGSRAATGSARTVAPDTIPRRSFIDVEIFDRLKREGVPSARLTTDEEFLRRASLDLTGRIPSPDDVRKFAADTAGDKRNKLIEQLVYSSEFNDKWTVWMGDLLQNVIATNNINRSFQGRNALNHWVRVSLDEKSLRDMVYEALTRSGNSFDTSEGAVNYIISGRQQGGPTQDWYDYMLYQAADKFLGVSHYDCLLCHDGRRHLDELSLWGKDMTRLDAQRMAAFFSRINIVQNADRTSLLLNSWIVSDRMTGNYALGTNFGNRPNRLITGNVRALDAEYRNGAKPGSPYWRGEFADNVMRDPLLAINFANRIWKALFNYGLVEPVNFLDPARLDPDNPPPAPWMLQASHPRLLQLLAQELAGRDFNLREFVRFLAESSAYQLSTRYEDEWNVSQVPLFARHYARRLEGEEVHDAIVKATGMFTPYTVQGFAETVSWAGRLPDPQEPRSNGTTLNFMNTFLRGNRDSVQRNQAGSILQQLYLMNDAFVTTRTKVAASPSLRAVSQIADNNSAVEEMFLLFLARRPTGYERGQGVGYLAKAPNAATRNTYLEDLAWALINKVEFIFSY